MQFPTDLLLSVLDFLLEDRISLCRCCLVNREFNCAASKFLYSEVVLNIRPSVIAFSPSNTAARPRSRYERFCDVLLASAILPANAPHVKILRVKGYPDSLSETLLPAVRQFKHLHTVQITPAQSRDGLFVPILDELVKDRPSLVNLNINAACMDEISAPIVNKLVGLRALGLEGPNRTILQLLPDWLDRLEHLKELHLTRNCGSITPGVLRSLIPLLENITAFSWGLSYSITDDDLFNFLGQLPSLEQAKLRHYLQYKPPGPSEPMKRLASLTICHDASDDEEFVDKLCDWALHAISESPIERIHFCCDEYPINSEAPRCFDRLVEHLAQFNVSTLRVLDLNGWLISDSSISLLASTCFELEELVMAVDPDGLAAFKTVLPTMKSLHTAALHVCIDEHVLLIVSAEDTAEIMQLNGTLRRLTVNEWKIEGSWVSQDDRVVFVVRHSSENASEEAPEIQVQSRSQHKLQAPAMNAIIEEEEEEDD
ncbi:hypothetical protein R3P38DRAFT_2621802 [Favolaschia claudopus]|uniref:F-box domain-containing protein n=1 Tax=Favolaschia claudopus TaxID=2862362 RepID=A0AAW0BSJ1_9AGAR